MEFRLHIQNALGLVVADRDQRITLRTPAAEAVATIANGMWTATLPVPFVPPTTLQIEIDNPRYFPFSTSFSVVDNPRTGVPNFDPLGPGLAHLVALTPMLADGIAALSKLVQVDTKPDPLRIARPEGPNWFHTQLGDEGPFHKGDEKPLLMLKDPVVGIATAKGVQRLIYDLQIPVRPSGKIYVFEYKTMAAPKLLFVWHPVQMQFQGPKPAAGGPLTISYHFYYHPTAHDLTAYPYGKSRLGDQPHVGVGYRHLMFETWGSVQHYYAKRRLVYVVPVASKEAQFGEAGNSLGIWTLLCELNLALHQVNGASFGDYQAHSVGRVAVSGFSAGANLMIAALADRTSPLGQSFVQDHLKELYCWDGAISGRGVANTVPQSFGTFAQKWWSEPDQRIRVYTQNAAYDKALAFLGNYAQPDVAGATGAYMKAWAKDGKEFATLVHLPNGFFRQSYAAHEDPVRVYQGKDVHPTDDGFPSYVDTHHWFFTTCMYHALTKSGFPSF